MAGTWGYIVRGRVRLSGDHEGRPGRVGGPPWWLGEEMELRRELLTVEMIEPGTGNPVRSSIEVRFDPLTGHSSRILPERGLMPAIDFDLEAFARQTQSGCPFCPGQIDRLTPKLSAGSTLTGGSHPATPIPKQIHKIVTIRDMTLVCL